MTGPELRMVADEDAVFQRYVHFTGITAIRVGDEVFLDPLWHRDLTSHTYLGRDIVVVCPVETAESAPADYRRVNDPRFRFHAIPTSKGAGPYLLKGHAFRTVLTAWREVRSADIVYAAVVEHPMPLGWVVFPIAALQKVPSYAFLESDFWRLTRGVPYRWTYRVRSAVTEVLNRLVLKLPRCAFMTHDFYEDLLPSATPRLVTPPAWYMPGDRASEDELALRRTADGGPLRILFASRLTAAKGVGDVIDALRIIDQRGGGKVRLTVLGGGELFGVLTREVAKLANVEAEVHAPVRYGQPFFDLIRAHDVVLVPIRSNEAPRIVLDAYSQGVPVVGSDAPGVKSLVREGATGMLYRAGDPQDLAATIERLLGSEGRDRLRAMGQAALRDAAHYDHAEMHARKSRFIRSVFSPAATPATAMDREARS